MGIDTPTPEEHDFYPEDEPRENRPDLVSLVSEVEAYNDQRGLGLSMARGILASLNPHEAAKLDDNLIQPGDLMGRHVETLLAVGLTLDPKNAPFRMVGAEEFDTSHLEISLADSKKFVGYLESTSDQDLDPNLTNALVKIAEGLAAQLLTKYDLGNPNDERMLEFFSSLAQVVEQYKRLAEIGGAELNQPAQTLDEILTVAREGYLKEFTEVKKSSAMTPIGEGYGPSTWLGDTNVEIYQNYWNRTFELLDFVGRNPQASELFNQLRDHLVASIEYAIRDEKSFLNHFSDTDRKSFQKIMSDIHRRLLETE